jgi:Predicted methyltransferase
MQALIKAGVVTGSLLTLSGCTSGGMAADAAAAAADAMRASYEAAATYGHSVDAARDAALSDSRRLPSEVARDPLRKPLDMLALTQLEPGEVIADIRPEEGYFTRLFAPVAGDEGRVYAFVPNQTAARENAYADTLAGDYDNVERVTGKLEEMTFDRPLDAVFMGEEYHDFAIPRFGVDVAAMNRRVFQVLKPCGRYVIMDHQAADGAGISVAGTLHWIEAAEVRRQVEAAGFVFDGQSDAVRVPSDNHGLSVFDESIRGRTDRFAYRFIKPCTATAVPPLAMADYGPVLASPIRTDADRERDEARQTLETLAFTGVRPGWKVADMIIGGGYFTRTLAAAVGPSGHVTAWQPAEFIGFSPDYANAITAAGAMANVTADRSPIAAPEFPAGLDLIFTAQNYHDLHLRPFGEGTAEAVNRRAFAALKRGGYYVIIDHFASPGSGLSATNSLHRIDRDQVIREVEAAGFILDEESRGLARDDDPLTANVFDASIRGRTSQFMLRFRKP